MRGRIPRVAWGRGCWPRLYLLLSFTLAKLLTLPDTELQHHPRDQVKSFLHPHIFASFLNIRGWVGKLGLERDAMEVENP